MNLVRDGVRVRARIARVEILFGEDRLTRAHVDEPDLHDGLAPRLLHGTKDNSVGAELAPGGKRHVVRTSGGRNRRVGVTRDHVELVLEVEVVPQHFTDRFCGFCSLGRERDEIGHGETRRRAGVTGDHDCHFRRLLRLRWCRRCGRLLPRRGNDSRRRHNSQSPSDRSQFPASKSHASTPALQIVVHDHR